MSETVVSEAMRAALGWLRKHNGTGVFDVEGVLLAAGERAPFMRSTWNKLRDAGLVAIDKRRASVTDAGRAFDCGKTQERMPLPDTRGAGR